MSDFEITNLITNFIQKTEKSSLSTLTSFGSKQSNSFFADFNKKYTQRKKQVQSKRNSSRKKYKNSSNSSSLIESELASFIPGILDLLNFDLDSIKKLFSGQIGKMIADLIGSATKAILGFVNGLSGIGSFDFSTLISNGIQSLTTALTNLGNSIVSGFNAAIDKLSNLSMNDIMALGKNVLPLAGLPGLNDSKVKNNFLKRKSGESSTSKYIQAILPNPKGGTKKNAGILSETPDAKIITPLLKKDTNLVKEMSLPKVEDLSGLSKQATSFLTSLTSKLSLSPSAPKSLVPKDKKKEVKEEKPTGDKAEYGKVTVKENKAGFVEISDETPGNTRKVNLHPSGSYDSKLDNGDAHVKTTGKKVDITEKNWEITVMEDMIVIVYKDAKIEIRNNKVENIHGNYDTNVDGEVSTKVTGDVTDNFDSNYNKKVKSNSITTISGNSSETVNGNVTENVSGNQNQTISGNLTINVTGNVNLTANNVNVSAKSQVAISAPKIKLG